MSTKISSYLSKQIFIEKNIVTFRSLSRALNIHVNEAKRELAAFYEYTRSSDDRSYATYLISGEVVPRGSEAPDDAHESMDVDEDVNGKETDELEDDGEEVPQIKLTLAGEQDLETARSSYARIISEHVYSLSPSPVLDVGLLCSPTDIVYVADAKFTADESALLGRISGPHVQIGKPIKTSNTHTISREPSKLPATSSAVQAARASVTEKQVDSTSQKPEKPTAKPKLTGKLDFGKAKPKAKPAESKAPAVKVKTEVEDKPIDKTEDSEKKQPGSKAGGSNFFTPKATNKRASKEASESQGETSEERPKAKEAAVKRGLKRKSIAATDTETEQEPPPPSSAAPSSPEESQDQFEYTVKGNAILSDDDDEPQPKPRVRGKGKAKPAFDLDFDAIPSRSERTRSLKAMMDIDDDEVEKVVRPKKTVQESSESAEEEQAEAADEDVVMADDSDVPPQKPKRQRKPKKVVPVGRNGLKKKRVVKSRMTTDAKGYMVTEDYSEYESVDEEEAEEAPPKPTKATKPRGVTKADKVKEADKEKSEQSANEKEPRKGFKPGLKRSGSSAGAGSKVTHKGSLMNFFGKK